MKILRDLQIYIDELLKDNSKAVIAIDGNCGAGKTVVAEKLRQLYLCDVIHMDDFFVPKINRTKELMSTPGWNVDTNRFKEEVLEKLEYNIPFEYSVFSCKIQKIINTLPIKRRGLLIIEGSYSQRSDFLPYYDRKLFLKCDKDIQLKRIKERNGKEKLQDFINIWIPNEEEYQKYYNIEQNADLVLTNNN